MCFVLRKQDYNMATILRYMKSPTSRVKTASDRQEESLLEDDIQLYDNMSHDGRAGRNLNSPEDFHRLEKDVSDEERALLDAAA